MEKIHQMECIRRGILKVFIGILVALSIPIWLISYAGLWIVDLLREIAEE